MALRQTLGLIATTTLSRVGAVMRGRAAHVSTLILAAAAPAAAQTILSITERALPGEFLSINGDGFDASAKVYGHYVGDTGTNGPDVQFQVLGYTSTSILTKVPTDMAGRLWQVWVKTNAGNSGNAYVNRARAMMLDSTDAAPNGTVRIFGRNMKAPGGVSQAPMVRLVSGPTNLAAPVIQASPFQLTFRVPATVRNGVTYKVMVRNGPGGIAGEVECPQTVTGLPNQRDVLNLGIPWASAIRFATNVYDTSNDSRLMFHTAGDGISNDAPAVRAAMQKAKADGGGIVYLPAGTYRIDDAKGIEVPSTVILKGDGPGSTILQFGYRFTPSNPAGGEGCPLAFDVGDLSGFMNMTFQNMNTGPVPNVTVGRHWYSVPHAHRFFFSNVDMQLGNGQFVFMEGTYKGVMQDCNITTTNLGNYQQSGPIYLGNVDQWTVRRTTMNYRVSRVYLVFSKHIVFENNTINRDNNYSGVVEAGGIETSYSSQLVILNNTIQGVGPTNRSNFDGEMIMSQKSAVQDVDDLSHPTSVGTTSLTNSNRNWPAVLTAPNFVTGRSVVTIVAGKGVGQWRRVLSNTSNTLTLDSPWTVQPNTSSMYSLTSFSNYQQYLIGNTVQNSSMGIQFYDGAVDSVIDSNQVTNAASIFLRCQDSAWTFNNSNRRHNVGWNVTISNNTVTNSDGVHMAQILVSALINGGVSYGNLIMNAEVRNNTVQSLTPVSYPDQMGSTEGYWNSVVFEGYYDGRSDPTSNVGAIWQGNTSNINVDFHDVGTALTGVGPSGNPST